MLIHDNVYGPVEIDSPAILDLIASPAMQRLKGISQFGLPDEYYFKKGFSRFEHCVGVMLLLRRLGASEEEQIAGLLHDVSHTAFSHVADWLVGTTVLENYQDTQHERYIFSTPIPGILARRGFDVRRICDYHYFTLLERSAPDLCADRVDYCLRELDPSVAAVLVEHLRAKDGHIVFDSQESAHDFAVRYLVLNMESWGSFEAVNRYRLLSQALRIAMDIGILTFDDLWHDDAYCLEKMVASGDERIASILRILRGKTLYDMRRVADRLPKKFRWVDPCYLEVGRLVRLSDMREDYKQFIQEKRRENDLGSELVAIG